MFNSNTDKSWENFGKNNPYFGVITDKKYDNENLTQENKEEFFKSGFHHVEHLLDVVKKHIDNNFNVVNALDFGCGVGRIVIPLSKIATQVVGIDISDSMLIEARKNCQNQGITNVEFVKSDDQLSLLKNNFNFIHSFVVFQHMSTSRGESILRHLLNILDDGGICILHFTYANTKSKLRKFVPLIKFYVPFASNIINLFSGRDFMAPYMQMNSYNLNTILFTLQQSNISNLHIEYTNHSGYLGVIIYFQKTSNS
jgi:ubiquinone/menaquinone biosynthesis C-methylase UbiE